MPLVTNDPGHGGTDPGAVGVVVEKDYNFMMADYANQRFQELGIASTMNRASTETLGPTDRTWRVRNSGAKYCLCWHNNAGGGNGSEVIYSIFSDGKLANLIAEELKAAGQNIRRVYSRQGSDGKDYYFMNRDTGAVETTIIETAFVDNAADAAQLQEHWKDFSEAVVKAFSQHIGHAYSPPTGAVQSSSTNGEYKEIPATVNGAVTKAIVVGENTHLIWSFLSGAGLREGNEFFYEFPTKDTVNFKVLGVDVPAVVYKGDSYLQWNKIPGMQEPKQRKDGGWDFTITRFAPPTPKIEPAVVIPSPAPVQHMQQTTDYAGHWAEKDIDRAIKLGLMKGSDDGKFYPDEPHTRAQFATVLGRLIDKGMMK